MDHARVWNPTTITAIIDRRLSSTQVLLVQTDQGRGFLKAMGNPEGPHALASDLVGTMLAKWFGLSTFEFAVIDVPEPSVLEIPFRDGGMAEPGPAFITRAVLGQNWSGGPRELKRLVNPEDLSALIVFDSWVKNRDRYFVEAEGRVRFNYDNVFLSFEGEVKGRCRVLAMDHTHCFTGGRGELTAKNLSAISSQDDCVYGYFPEFEPFVSREQIRHAAKKLRSFTSDDSMSIVNRVPREWDVGSPVRDAWAKFIHERSQYVSRTIEETLYPQRQFDFMKEEP